jgi:hypothetical protein
MGFVHRAFVAAGVGIAVSAIAGCGSSGGRWLSQSQANRLTAELNNVQQSLDVGQCTRAQRYLTDFQNAVSGLGGVNSTLVANLNQGASTIQSLTSASSECRGSTVTTPKTHTTKTRASTTTTRTQTRTVPTFTEPTTTQPTQPTQTYTYTAPSTSTTSTTGGQGIDTTTNTINTTTTTSSTTTSNGGTGLGGTGLGGTSTTTSGGTSTTSTTGTSGTTGSGF